MFKYTNALYDESGEQMEYADEQKNVKSVRFPISRYEAHTHTIGFLYGCTVKKAIEAAEKFLSKPPCKKYWDMIREDSWADRYTWEEVRDDYETRGACLTDGKLLEAWSIDEHGCLTFSIGS